MQNRIFTLWLEHMNKEYKEGLVSYSARKYDKDGKLVLFPKEWDKSHTEREWEYKEYPVRYGGWHMEPIRPKCYLGWWNLKYNELCDASKVIKKLHEKIVKTQP